MSEINYQCRIYRCPICDDVDDVECRRPECLSALLTASQARVRELEATMLRLCDFIDAGSITAASVQVSAIRAKIGGSDG